MMQTLLWHYIVLMSLATWLMAPLYSFHMCILFCFFPQSDEMYLNHILKGGIGVNINPLQIASHFECPDALVVILQYLLGLCKKDKDSTELRQKLSKIIHVKEIVKKTNNTAASNFSLLAAFSSLKKESL